MMTHLKSKNTAFPFTEQSLYTIAIGNDKQEKKVIQSLTRLFSSSERENIGYILKEPAFIHYFTILQNILLTVKLAKPKLRSPELLILDALEESYISPDLANKKIDSLTDEQKKEVQLIASLCAEKKIILVDDWLKNENGPQLKNWIMIFKSLIKQKGLSIIVLTSDDNIANLGDIQLSPADL